MDILKIIKGLIVFYEIEIEKNDNKYNIKVYDTKLNKNTIKIVEENGNTYFSYEKILLFEFTSDEIYYINNEYVIVRINEMIQDKSDKNKKIISDFKGNYMMIGHRIIEFKTLYNERIKKIGLCHRIRYRSEVVILTDSHVYLLNARESFLAATVDYSEDINTIITKYRESMRIVPRRWWRKRSRRCRRCNDKIEHYCPKKEVAEKIDYNPLLNSLMKIKVNLYYK